MLSILIFTSYLRACLELVFFQHIFCFNNLILITNQQFRYLAWMLPSRCLQLVSERMKQGVLLFQMNNFCLPVNLIEMRFNKNYLNVLLCSCQSESNLQEEYKYYEF